MDLRVKSEEIRKAFEDTKTELLKRKQQISDDIQSYTDDYREANTHGDRSENAAFEEAVKNLQRANADYAEVESNLSAVNLVKDLEKYVPIGVVVLYTTVHLRCLEDNTEYVYRIFPKGVSDLERGIMAEDTRISKALMGKTKGDIIRISHIVESEELSYVIEDIY